ncbi:SH3 domain-containing protein [Chitinophaga alhagiae]|uniref:SH3 domain-containing protein n=1 Tax=Chitinophaga alhagiae TaxID=2203219 RepID=UPI000E5B41CD|nr:SH3 domain-containing protein [Chitinophaga alhagiae]
MRHLAFLALLCLSLQLHAQFALVEDKDGYVNVRDKPSLSGTVTGRVPSGNIVFCMETAGEWYSVDYGSGKQTGSGYIHRSRLQMVRNFPEIAVQKATEDSIIFRQDSLRLVLGKRLFRQENRQLQYNRSGEYQYLARIDGRDFWGTDGGLPRQEYSVFRLSWKGRPVNMPDSAFNDVFEPNFFHTQLRYDSAGGRCFVEAINSDGAGGYVVIWMFERGVYKTRQVFYGF